MKKEVIAKLEEDRIDWVPEDHAHSFINALHKTLKYCGSELTRADIAGRTGMAFKLTAHKEMCPSAMSVMDWNLLGAGANNCVKEAEMITRLWHEEQLEVTRREEAHELIEKALEKDSPTVVWDVSIPEWELITGVDTEKRMYRGISCSGADVELEMDKLGRREIPILFVLGIVDGESVDRLEAFKQSIRWAIDHLEGNEFCERPDYEIGLKAYDLWIRAFDQVKSDDWESRYYLETYSTMKRFAADYLERVANWNESVEPLAKQYMKIYSAFENALKARNTEGYPSAELIGLIKDSLAEARKEEEVALGMMKKWLTE